MPAPSVRLLGEWSEDAVRERIREAVPAVRLVREAPSRRATQSLPVRIREAADHHMVVSILEEGETLNRSSQRQIPKWWDGERFTQFARVLEGRPVFLNELLPGLYSHLGDGSAAPPADNLAGVLRNVRTEVVDGVRNLVADLRGFATEAFERLREAYQDAMAQGLDLGLSVVADTALRLGLTTDGRHVDVVDRMLETEAWVDVATIPSSGGRVLRMVAADPGGIMLERIWRALARLAPWALEGLSRETASVEDLRARLTDATRGDGLTRLLDEAGEDSSGARLLEVQRLRSVAGLLEGEQEDEATAALDSIIRGQAGPGSDPARARGGDPDPAPARRDPDPAPARRDPAPAPAPDPARARPPATDPARAQSDVDERVAELERRAEAAEARTSQAELRQRLSGDGEVLEAIAEDYLATYAGRRLSAAEITDIQRRARATSARVRGNQGVQFEPSGRSVERIMESGLDTLTRQRIGFMKLVGVRRDPDTNPELCREFTESQWAGVPAFQRLREGYTEITGDAEVRGRYDYRRLSRDVAQVLGASPVELQRIREAVTTATWAEILADALHQRMMRDYRRVPIQELEFVRIREGVRDFREQKSYRLGGYPDVPIVAEGGEYLAPPSTPGDLKVGWNVQKRGYIETVTMETIVDDNLGAVVEVPVRMARAARRTLGKFIMNLLLAYGAGLNDTDWEDTNPLYSGTPGRGNLTVGAYGFASLQAAVLAIEAQAEDGSGETGILEAWATIYPSQLQFVAEEAIDPMGKGRGKPETNTNEGNVLQGRLRGYKSQWFNGLTDVGLVIANPELAETVEIGFLNDRQDPEVILADMPATGLTFTHDVNAIKLRHPYGGKVQDPKAVHLINPNG